MQEIGGLQLAKNGKQYSVLPIDTPPRLDSKLVIEGVQRADAVLVATSPSPADLFTSRDTAEVLKREGVEARSRLVFNQVQPGTILARDLDEMAGRIGLTAMKSKLARRQAYQHAVVMGWKSLPSEAREEVFKVALEVTAFAKNQNDKIAK